MSGGRAGRRRACVGADPLIFATCLEPIHCKLPLTPDPPSPCRRTHPPALTSGAPAPPAGVPFRETHHISGAAVKLAEDRGCELSALTVADLQGIHPLFADDVELVCGEGCG